ncbi:MAG TPA: N-acetylmuramoyl-L-alanine amidase [Steroidobacteraceae bacterium]|nr:N-acetylmuramoyl-L-alanine amidase [Steroidobacteraceae bacterium]
MIVALGGLATGAPLVAAQLRGIQLNADAAAAQLRLDLDEPVAQKVFLLERPSRVVIDLKGTRRGSAVRVPAPAGVVTSVRVGTQPGNTLRIVLETSTRLRVHSLWGGARQPQLTVSLGEPAAAAVAAASASAAAPIRAAHAPEEAGRDVIVAVDAGHGGQDPGAIGRGGTREKDVTLAIARALAERINAEPGMRAVLTRDRDEFIELRDRIRRARQAHADMFISVHADSVADRSVSGASVYVLSVHGASSEAARWLAERENAADLAGGVRLDDKGSLAPVLLDATQSEIIGVSASAAERVVNALASVGEIRKAQVQQAGFVVLKSPDIPSMLVETAYISNPDEERRLRSSGQQARLAEAIAGGLHSFFQQNPPDGTRFKQQRRETLASAAAAAGASATP